MASTISAGLTTTTALVYSADTSGVLQLQTNGTTTAVTIDTSQNVGVGVTANTTNLGGTYKLLSVGASGGSGIFTGQSDSTSTNSNIAQFLGKTTGTSGYQLVGGVVVALDGASTSNAVGRLQFYTASGGSLTEGMRLDSNGNLGLGVTPLTTWSGRSVFQIGSAGQMNYGSGTSNGGSMAYGNNGYWNGSADKAITTGYSQIVALNDNGTGRVIVVTTSGTSSAGATISYTAGPYVSAGNTSWTNSSDERLKNITGLITNGLESVNTLRAAKYTWKDDATNKPKVGLIAQDVQKVLPEAVETFNKYNSEDTTEYLGVTYTEVIPLLVAAIQELSAKVTALEAKVGA